MRAIVEAVKRNGSVGSAADWNDNLPKTATMSQVKWGAEKPWVDRLTALSVAKAWPLCELGASPSTARADLADMAPALRYSFRREALRFTSESETPATL